MIGAAIKLSEIPRKLAANNRLATKAAIKRGTKQAQAELARIDKKALDDLTGLYEHALIDIQDRINNAADAGGILRLSRLQDLLSQSKTRLAQLERARNDLLISGMTDGAQAGTDPFKAAAVSSTFDRIPGDTVRFVQNLVGEDGLQLSDRIWRIDNHARDIVGQAIQSHIIQGHSASEAAADLLSRGEAVPADIANKLNMAAAERVTRAVGTVLMQSDSNPYKNALRLFRTELNRAHNAAYETAAFESEDTIGTRFLLSPHHPRPDICDMHASVNRYGLGPGVYPKGKNPYPAHPNTLSFIEVVFADEVTQEDRAGKETRIEWLKRQEASIQDSVLGSTKKRAALQKGILKENQIATPWKVLKIRFERGGINIDDLTVPPAVEQIKKGTMTTIRDADEYVKREGIRTKWEHAWAFDVKTGATFFRKTSRIANAVQFNDREISYLKDKNNSIRLTHNHPSSTSLSAPDLYIASLPGVQAISAIGHESSRYLAEVMHDTDKFGKIYHQVETAAMSEFWDLIGKNSISRQTAGALHTHVINQILHEGGAIKYYYERLPLKIQEALNDIGRTRLKKLINNVKTSTKWE